MSKEDLRDKTGTPRPEVEANPIKKHSASRKVRTKARRRAARQGVK